MLIRYAVVDIRPFKHPIRKLCKSKDRLIGETVSFLGKRSVNDLEFSESGKLKKAVSSEY